jgi:hypothetical protein
VHLVQSDRVKPVSTRLPRLVARGCPAAALGHFVRDTCLRRISPDDKPSVRNAGPAVMAVSEVFPVAPGRWLPVTAGDSGRVAGYAAVTIALPVFAVRELTAAYVHICPGGRCHPRFTK